MRKWLILALACSAALWPGCQCGRLEIGPTNLLLAGDYQGLWGFPWGNNQKFLLADKLDEKGQPSGDVSVIRLADGTSCDLSLSNPRWFWAVNDSLFVFEGIDWNRWTGRLLHVPLPCGPPQTVLEDVFIDVWTAPDQTHFYVITEASADTGLGTLTRVSWPGGRVEKLHQGIPSWRFRFDRPEPRYLYIDDDGKLVIKSFEGTEIGRFGEGVTYSLPSGSGEVIFEQSPKMFKARVDGSELVQLSEDACAPSFGATMVTYLEPCTGPERELVVRDRETWEVVGRYGHGISRFRTYPEGWISWMEGQADFSGPGTLWVKPPDREPVSLGEQVSPNWYIISELGLVLHARNTGPGLAWLVSADLFAGTSSVIAEDIDANLIFAQSPWSIHVAVVTDAREVHSDGGAQRLGNLHLIHPKGTERLLVAGGVPVNGFRFSWQAPAIGYLRDYDVEARAGFLEVLSMIDQEPFAVEGEVSEFTEVFAPRRGVAYTIRTPGRSGIYFVEATIEIL